MTSRAMGDYGSAALVILSIKESLVWPISVIISFLVCLCCIATRSYSQDVTVMGVAKALDHSASEFTGPNAQFKLKYVRYAAIDKTASRYSGGYLKARWTIAHKGANWYSARVFTEKDSAEYNKPYTVILNSEKVLDWKSGSRYVSVTPFNEIPNIVGATDTFFRFAGINAALALHRDSGVKLTWTQFVALAPDELDRPTLPNCLLDANNNYRIQSSTHDKVVVASEWDELECDPRKQFAVLRRKTRFGPDLPLRCEIVNSDFREVRPNVWVPYHTEEFQYAKYKAEDKSLWDKVTAVLKYRVESLDFDNLSDSLFNPELPVGTRVIDTTSGMKYEVTGSDKPFSSEITAARKQLGTIIKPSNGSRLIYPIIFGACVGTIVGAWLWKRYR